MLVWQHLRKPTPLPSLLLAFHSIPIHFYSVYRWTTLKTFADNVVLFCFKTEQLQFVKNNLKIYSSYKLQTPQSSPLVERERGKRQGKSA